MHAAKIRQKFRTAKRFGEKFWKGEVLMVIYLSITLHPVLYHQAGDALE